MRQSFKGYTSIPLVLYSCYSEFLNYGIFPFPINEARLYVIVFGGREYKNQR